MLGQQRRKFGAQQLIRDFKKIKNNVYSMLKKMYQKKIHIHTFECVFTKLYSGSFWVMGLWIVQIFLCAFPHILQLAFLNRKKPPFFICIYNIYIRSVNF